MTATSGWTTADLPDQSGRTVLVTGANSGLGLQVSRALAARGARVLLGCRDEGRGAAALAQVRGTRPGAQAELVPLDLADLASVRVAAARVAEAHPGGLDVLVDKPASWRPRAGRRRTASSCSSAPTTSATSR